MPRSAASKTQTSARGTFGVVRSGGIAAGTFWPRRAVVTKGGVPVALSSLELRLLRYLVEHRGEVLSRDRLLDEVWGYDATPVSRSVDVHVASLRAKVETNPSHPEFIVTVHRLGYRFDG